MYIVFFRYSVIAHLVQCSENITFIGTGKPQNSSDSLYWNIYLIVVVRNWIYNISNVCIKVIFFFLHVIIQLLKRIFFFLWIAIEPLLKTNWPYMYSCVSGLYSIPLIFVSVICQNLTVLIITAQWFSTWDNVSLLTPPGYLAMSGDKFGCHNWWVVSCNAQNGLPQQRIIQSKMLIVPRLRYSVKLYSKSWNETVWP